MNDAALAPEKIAAAVERLKLSGAPALETPADLAALADRFGLGVNDWRGGAGKYRDIAIGTGCSVHQLHKFAEAARAAGILCRVQQVNVPGHVDYGKCYAEVQSFWWE